MLTRVAAHPGVGLRLPHLAEVAATRPAVGWLEVHPETFLANPHARELLVEIAGHYPISVHTVGVSIGSAHGLDKRHLKRVAQLIEDIDAVLVSGHLAWSTHPGEYLNDLLPLPYTEDTLRIVCAHVDEVQNALGRQYLVENPASYLGFRGSTMTEASFLNQVVERTGCGLLCDVSNVHVSSHNLGYDPHAYLEALPGDAIGELHLGGFTAESDEATPGGHVLIDEHASVIDDDAWELYRRLVARLGTRPTLIEWDNALPAVTTLMSEALKARLILDAVEGSPRAIAS